MGWWSKQWQKDREFFGSLSRGELPRPTTTSAESTEEPKRRSDIEVVGTGAVLVGALVTVIGVFLPRVESPKFTFGGIAENTLIQSGDGWIFLGFAVAMAAAAYRSYQNKTKSWAVLVFALIIIGLAIYEGTSDDALTLYALDPETGNPNSLSDPVKASPAIGIYAVGAGGFLGLIGGYRMRSSPPFVEGETQAAEGDARRGNGDEPKKQCPDCAETVQAAARVCKHCGYRFDQHQQSAHSMDR